LRNKATIDYARLSTKKELDEEKKKEKKQDERNDNRGSHHKNTNEANDAFVAESSYTGFSLHQLLEFPLIFRQRGVVEKQLLVEYTAD
jgi:hypothetical protein